MIKLIHIDFKSNLLKLYLGILILLITCFYLYGVSNLTHDRITQFLELIFVLIGIILFSSLYAIDQHPSIIKLINSKALTYQTVFILRLLLTLVFINILSLLTLSVFALFNSEVQFLKDLFICITSSVFIGVVCLFISAVFHHSLSGYMFGLVYFLICLGFRNLGVFYLFSETFHFPFQFKIVQFVCSAITLLVMVLFIKRSH